MPSTSPTPDTTAWRELLPWATVEERRTMLDSEWAAGRYAEGLRAAGIPLSHGFVTDAALNVLAAVLAEVHGAPERVIEGEAIIRL